MKLDARRINDILSAVGIAGAALVGMFVKDPALKELFIAAFAYIGGLGRRGYKHEYQEVADAKAEAKVAKEIIASISPPPITTEQIVEAIKRSVPPPPPPEVLVEIPFLDDKGQPLKEPNP